MFDKKQPPDMIAADQAKIDGACGFIISLMAQIASTKTATKSLIDEMEQKRTIYEQHLKHLNEVHKFCINLEGASPIPVLK
jgi:hypothetical protein